MKNCSLTHMTSVVIFILFSPFTWANENLQREYLHMESKFESRNPAQRNNLRRWRGQVRLFVERDWKSATQKTPVRYFDLVVEELELTGPKNQAKWTTVKTGFANEAQIQAVVHPTNLNGKFPDAQHYIEIKLPSAVIPSIRRMIVFPQIGSYGSWAMVGAPLPPVRFFALFDDTTGIFKPTESGEALDIDDTDITGGPGFHFKNPYFWFGSAYGIGERR